MKIGIVVFENFTDLDFYLPWDLLNRVRLLGLRNDWKVEILGDQPAYSSAAGLEIKTTKPYEFANECQGVFFCSGPKTRTLIKDRDFLEKFRINPETQAIAAIDSGALVVGALGLLKGRSATTYPSAMDLLAQFDAKPMNTSFVDDHVATGARCLAGDKLALWMIERLAGKPIADKVYESVAPLR